MRKARIAGLSGLFIATLVLALPLSSYAQNREKFVISARAGGVNTVTGRASMRPHGNSEWQLLTIREDLETGDVVKTGQDGRVEVLLNPGSYMRIGENSEVELANNSLENLEVRLIRGTAIVEVTGAEDQEMFIGITTPHAKLSIVRRGLYRVNVVPGDTTELIVRKGRVMLEDSHTKVKGGNKVVFSGTSFSVAKLRDAEKKNLDTFEAWSKDRGQALAKANSKIPRRTLDTFALSFLNDWSFSNRPGFWLYSSGNNCYTFIPFTPYYASPYGGSYAASLWGFGGCRGCRRGWLDAPYGNRGGYPTPGNPASSGGTGVGIGSSGPGSPISDSSMTRQGKPEISSAGDGPARRPQIRE